MAAIQSPSIYDSSAPKIAAESQGLPEINVEKLKKSLKPFQFLHLKDFSPPSGTATLKDARIIFLGESDHSNINQPVLFQMFIKAMAKEGDIVLVEGKQCLEPQDATKTDSTVLIKKKIVVYGWDNYEMWKQTIESFQDIRKCQGFLDKLSKEPKTEANIKLIKELEEKSNAAFEKFKLLIPGRDECLLTAVKTCLLNLKPKQRIFVISGDLHLRTNIHHFKNEQYFYLKFASKPVDCAALIKYFKDGYHRREEFKKDKADSKSEAKA